MFVLRTMAFGLFLLITGALAAEERVTVTVPLDRTGRHFDRLESYPVLVLKSGERIRYARYKIVHDRVEVRSPDGGVRTFDREDLDFEATVRAGNAGRTPKTSRRQASGSRGSGPRTGLAAFAATATIEVPEPNQQDQVLEVDLSKANLIEVKAAPPDLQDSAADRRPFPEKGPDRAVEAELPALSAAQRRLSSGLREVSSDCGGYTVGRGSSCGGGGVVARRYTAACQDAVRRARAEVPRVRDALTRLRVQCRKSGMNPGETRSFLNQQGLEGLEKELGAADAGLAGWQRDISD
ncbi:MAG: hypothetical protein ABFS37_10600 [Acidobacteriota bacterium]